MSPPSKPRPSPQTPPPLSWVWLVYEYFRLLKRNSVYFAWVVIVPIGMAYISVQVSGAVPRDSDKTLVQWLVAYGAMIIPQAMFIVACLRVLFFSGQGLTLFGVTVGLWERRVMLLSVPYALLEMIRYSIANGLHAWAQGEYEMLASVGAWAVWGLQQALFAMSLLALCYFAEQQNGKIMEAVVQSWRNMRRHGMRVVGAFIVMLVVWQFIGKPLWLEYVLPTGAPINRVVAWVFVYYFYGVTTALMAYLAFRHIHPDDVLVLSLPTNQE